MLGIGRVYKLLTILMVFIACSMPNKDILPINKMKVVFLHHMMVEEMLNNYQLRDSYSNFDSSQNAAFRNLLIFHKIDSSTFYKSLQYYKSDVKRFNVLIDSAKSFAAREREKRYAAEQASASVDTTKIDTLMNVPDSLNKY